jgi:hypothetical protein
MQLHAKYSLCTHFSGIINFIIFKTKLLSRCSVFGTATRLRTGRSWYQMPPGLRFFYFPNLLQTPGFTQPGIRWVQGSFARNKAAKSCFWPLTTTSDRRSLWVELYIGFLSMPTWLGQGRHIYLTENVESMQRTLGLCLHFQISYLHTFAYTSQMTSCIQIFRLNF